MVERRTLRVVVLVAVVAVVGVLTVGAAVYGFLQPEPSSVEHVHEYEVAVEPNRTLTNVTLYLPVPVAGGESVVGEAVAAGSPGVVDRPGNWSYAVVDTEYGPMLRVTAPRIEPRTTVRPRPRPTPETPPATTAVPGTVTPADGRVVVEPYRIEASVPTKEPVDTRDPVGRKPTLAPRSNARETACSTPVTEGAVCRSFETRVFLAYDAPADATVGVYVRYEGRNEWFEGGWTGNAFTQRVAVERRGPGTGWVVVTATERTGVGAYPGGDLAP
ncbi:MAG: hypothetical protein ABEJ30_04620 [Halorientalis sp.]